MASYRRAQSFSSATSRRAARRGSSGGLGERGVELREELLVPARQIRQRRVRQELGQRGGDDGLAAVEVLVELDRVGRLGDVVDEERDDADVEVPEEPGHLGVRPLAEQTHVRKPRERREIHVEVPAGQHDRRLGVAPGDLLQERHIHPRRQRAVVADDRMANGAEYVVLAVGRAIVLGIDAVLRQDEVARGPIPLLPQTVGRHDRRIGGAHQGRFARQDLLPEARKVRPLVHAVVDHAPAQPVAQPLCQRRPEGIWTRQTASPMARSAASASNACARTSRSAASSAPR